ncbi:MAG: KH domain-containing protein [Acidimicrobiaceae bacterium]|nr:KH domain-containing protein [Acidimicrobiaceae bacterium]
MAPQRRPAHRAGRPTPQPAQHRPAGQRGRGRTRGRLAVSDQEPGVARLDQDADAVDDEQWDDEDRPPAGRAGDVLSYLATQIVDDPEQVSIEPSRSRTGVKLSLHVSPDDMGKVIGRRGRVAQSIRTVVRAAGAAEGLDVLVDIVD